MIFLYLLAIVFSYSFAMDPNTRKKIKEFQQLSLAQAKDKISTAIAFDESYDLKILLQLFGPQISKEEKNKHLLNCYARPYSAPLILALGANPNVHNNCECRFIFDNPNNCKKYSILHEAAERGNPGVVEALLDFKAHVDAVEKDTQETPLMKACRIKAIYYSRGDARSLGNYLYLIRKLIDVGANLKLTNNAGKTARQIAQTEIQDPKARKIVVDFLSCQKIS